MLPDKFFYHCAVLANQSHVFIGGNFHDYTPNAAHFLDLKYIHKLTEWHLAPVCATAGFLTPKPNYRKRTKKVCWRVSQPQFNSLLGECFFCSTQYLCDFKNC